MQYDGLAVTTTVYTYVRMYIQFDVILLAFGNLEIAKKIII